MSRNRRRTNSVGQQLQSRIEDRLPARRKDGPREIGRNRVKLASERAGIKPMTAAKARDMAKLGQMDLRRHGGGRPGGSGGKAGQKNTFMQKNPTALAMPQKVTQVDPQAYYTKTVGEAGTTEASQEELRRVFEEVDLDNSGTIELDEFIHAFGNLPGLQLDEPQLVKLFREVDTDGSGSIDYDEFVVAYRRLDVVQAFMEQQIKAAGMSSRKAGPREIRQNSMRVRLASERAGIRPAHCMDNVGDPNKMFQLQSGQSSSSGNWGLKSATPARKLPNGATVNGVGGKRGRQRSGSGPLPYYRANSRRSSRDRYGQPAQPRGGRQRGGSMQNGDSSPGRGGSSSRSRSRGQNGNMIDRFTAMAGQQEKPELTEEEMQAAFDQVDIDNSGTIELDEFVAALKQLGVGYDVHQATQLFKELDTDMNGILSYNEFKEGYDRIDVVKAFVEQQCKAAGLSTRKVGPRELGRSVKLASERAGIRAMTATQAAAEAQQSVNSGGFWKKKVPKSALRGFSSTRKDTRYDDAADTGPAKKLGPREIGRNSQRGGGMLWSVRMGIKPMTARQAAAEADPDFTRRRVTASSLQGFSATRRTPETYDTRQSSYSARSQGRSRARQPYASRSRSGSYDSRNKANGNDGPQARGRAKSSGGRRRRAKSAGTNGFGYGGKSSARNNNGARGITAIQRKEGPREIGRSRVKLASERAGIKPMTAAMARDDAIAGQKQDYGVGIWANESALRKQKKTTKDNTRKWFREHSAEAVHKVEEDLREAFSRVDLDNSNSIELDEFVSAMKYLGAEMDIHQMEKLFHQLDTDDSGFIDYREFRAGYDRIDVMKAFIERSLKSAGLSTRKAGPREIGRSQKLASELAGIKPMTASQAAAEADPNFTRKKITRASLKGFSSQNRDRGPRSHSRTIRKGRGGGGGGGGRSNGYQGEASGDYGTLT